MRMHSYGKCTPNVIVGALLIFSVILLYNFWNSSTLNHDLGLKIHNLEQQLITLSKNNDALQSNLEKIHDEKGNLQITIQKEDSSIKSLQADLETSKKKAQTCREESNTLSSRIQAKDKEITELKSKVVSLQAQITEKSTVNERLEKELRDTKESLEKEIAKLKLTSPKPFAAKPGIDVANGDPQPVLISDPAEAEMNKPDLAAPGVPSPPLKQPDGDHKPSDNQMTGEGAQESLGVLPVPGQPAQQLQPQGNLDAQEDDGDRPMKEDLTQQDDQSPDGALSQKEKDLAGIPQSAMKTPSDPAARIAPLGGHSAQDVREAAHNPAIENQQIELNNV